MARYRATLQVRITLDQAADLAELEQVSGIGEADLVRYALDQLPRAPDLEGNAEAIVDFGQDVGVASAWVKEKS